MAENEDEYHFDPNLYGNWVDTSAQLEVFIDTAGASDSKMYSIIIVHHEAGQQPAQDSSHFRAILIKSGGKKFMNLTIDKNSHQFKNIGTAAVDLIPETYFILKLEEKNGELIMSNIDVDVLNKLIQNKAFTIKYSSKTENEFLFTEKPKQLKIKMNELDKHKGAFKELYKLSKSN